MSTQLLDRLIMAADTELVAEPHDGSNEALAQAYTDHGRMVYNVCLRVLGNATSAEDATQAVFLLLLRKAPTLPSEIHLAGWLHRTAELVAREGRRAEVRLQKREREAVEMATLQSQALPAADAWLEIRPKLDGAVAQLPEKYRTPLVLVYFEGHDQQAVARRMGIPDGTLRWRLAHALERLRLKLGVDKRKLSVLALGTLLAGRSAEAAPSGAIPRALSLTANTLATRSGAAPAASVAVLNFVEAGRKALWWNQVKMAATVAAALTMALASIPILQCALATDAPDRAANGAAERPVAFSEPTGVREDPGVQRDEKAGVPAKAEGFPDFPPGPPVMALDQTAAPEGGRIVLYSRNRHGNYPLASFAFHLGLRGDDRRVRNAVNLLFGNVKRADRFSGEPVNQVPEVLGNGAAGMDAGPGKDEFRVQCMGGDEHRILDLGALEFATLTAIPKDWTQAPYRAAVHVNHVYVVRLFDPEEPPLQDRFFKVKVLRHRENDAVLLDWAPLQERPAAPAAEEF